MEEGNLIVGIGASAGGLESIQKLFGKIPSDLDATFIIIQHLSPDFKSLMPELLSKHTKIKIETAEDGQEIEPSCIYLNQRNKDLAVKDGKFVLSDKTKTDGLNLPIDSFFNSLAEEFKQKSIAIVLSGSGSDGSRGVRRIKEEGGIIIVQDPNTAQFDGMPNSTISTGLVDYIDTPENIASFIESMSLKSSGLIPTHKNTFEEKVNDILDILSRESTIRFKSYKRNTINRRIEKRMSLVHKTDINDYIDYLNNSQNERQILVSDFLIGVTSFFRDNDAFEELIENVIPEICESKHNQDTIRIWIPGCSTGEEVYSIAILFDDYIRKNQIATDYKIFATDVDSKAVAKAGLGIYNINSADEIDEEILNDYFIKTGDKFQIIQKVRDKIVFSVHNILTDPPFIRLDLISCRNLLIYLDIESQRHILLQFQFSLNKGGFLFLGNSENLGESASNFKVISSKWKIYKSKFEHVKRFGKSLSNGLNPITKHLNNTKDLKKRLTTDNKLSSYEQFVLNNVEDAIIFIDAEYNIKYMNKVASNIIVNQEGMFDSNILNKTDENLSSVISINLRKAKKENVPVKVNKVPIEIENEIKLFNVSISKVNTASIENNYVLRLEELPHNQNKVEEEDFKKDFISNERIVELENEIKSTREVLQSVVEDLEASNEELQSSNEELMSSNEELQSTNEELQSVNEELYSVNTELQDKNRELETVNNDLSNLMDSSEIGTLFLDDSLRIRTFTKALKKNFELLESDIGRPLKSFASNFNNDQREIIFEDCVNALDKFKSTERQVNDLNGRTFITGVRPFLTDKRKVDGVVLTFIDISDLRKTQDNLILAEKKFETLFDNMNEGFVNFEMIRNNDEEVVDLKYLVVNTFYESIIDLKHENLTDQLYSKISEKLLDPFDWLEILKEEFNLEGASQREIFVDNKYYQLNIFKNNSYEIGVTISDITDTKNYQDKLLDAIQKAEIASSYKNMFLANMSHELRTPMNSVIGFSKLLRRDDLEREEILQYLSIIENSSNQLLALIDDIVDVAKIEAGEMKFNIEEFRLDKLLKELTITYSNTLKTLERENIKIINDNSDIDQFILNSDEMRIKQVLMNLINNSIKYSLKGEIHFGFEYGDDLLKFYVSDEGIGIPQKEMQNVMKSFQRLDDDDTGGAGLGLSICKGIVELLDGEIYFDTDWKNGTKVYFTIPNTGYSNDFVEEGEKEGNKSIDDYDLSGKKFLIVDDEKMIHEFYSVFFSKTNLEIDNVYSGSDAIDKTSTNDYDLILMDIKMPKMSGVDAMKIIKENGFKNKIVAQTALALQEDKPKFLEDGFDYYVSKPIDENEMCKIIEEAILA